MVIKTTIPEHLPEQITGFYIIDKNTFVAKDTKDVHNSFETEIGDILSDDFQPQLKIKRWDNECNFSLRLIDDDINIPVIETEGNKIKFIKENKECHFYDIENGFEFEVILKEKPNINKVLMSIETKRLGFYYQPELIQEEIEEGAFRPDNVVGSYAVYHESKQGNYSKIGKKNYQAGKAFHIYRPKIIDSTGKGVWGVLNIDIENKLLTVEIPQEFLDNAIYPIRHAAGLTIGYTTKGASDMGTNTVSFACHSGVSPDNEAGTVNELMIACESENYAIKVGVYTDSGDVPNSLIANSNNTFTPSSPDGNGFYAAGISGFDIIANTRYWFAFIPSHADGDVYYDSITVSPSYVYYTADQTYADWMKATFPTGLTINRRLSIYCTYTAIGAEVAPTGIFYGPLVGSFGGPI